MKPKRIMCGGRTSVQLALKPMVVMYLSSDGDADRARIYTAAPPPPPARRRRRAAVPPLASELINSLIGTEITYGRDGGCR